MHRMKCYSNIELKFKNFEFVSYDLCFFIKGLLYFNEILNDAFLDFTS